MHLRDQWTRSDFIVVELSSQEKKIVPLQNMETIYSILSTIILFIVIAIIWFGYHLIQRLIIRHKFSEYIDYFKLFKYNYAGFYNHKGKGLIYRKKIQANEMKYLLKTYGFKDHNISSESAIFENLAIVEFPYWEERFDIIVQTHGGVRFYLFYNIEIKEEDKCFTRPFNIYINEDTGEYIDDSISIDGDLIQGTIVYLKRFALKDFVENEMKFWQNKNKI